MRLPVGGGIMTLGDVGQGEFGPSIFEKLSALWSKKCSVSLGLWQLQEMQTLHTTSSRVMVAPEGSQLYLCDPESDGV